MLWLVSVACVVCFIFFFFQAEDGIRDLVRSRGLGDVYKRQSIGSNGDGGRCIGCVVDHGVERSRDADTFARQRD